MLTTVANTKRTRTPSKIRICPCDLLKYKHGKLLCTRSVNYYSRAVGARNTNKHFFFSFLINKSNTKFLFNRAIQQCFFSTLWDNRIFYVNFITNSIFVEKKKKIPNKYRKKSPPPHHPREIIISIIYCQYFNKIINNNSCVIYIYIIIFMQIIRTKFRNILSIIAFFRTEILKNIYQVA